MAMQSGVGLSKLIFMVGAGYTGTILASRLPDILRELQDILQSDKPVDPSEPNYSGVVAQVHRLAMEVRQLALAQPITVLNGDSGQMGSITSLAMPAAALGALGYGYMWSKGFSFFDLMYVTKRNMTTAVSSMTKHLEQVSAAIADMIFKQCDAYKDSRFDFGSAAAIRNREKMSPDKWWDWFGSGTPELKKLAIRILSQCISASGCERNWSIFEHIHSPKRNRLEHQRLNDLVFVHYNLKLRERDMLKRTGNAASDPISLENINILADWVAEEAPLLTIEDVDGWTTIEQPAQVQEGLPDFDGGDEIGGPVGEDLGANEDDNHYYSDA